MKTPFFISAALLLLTSALTVSCNSCDKRQASELPADETTGYNDAAAATDTVATADADAAAPAVVPSSKKANRPTTQKQSSETKPESKTGYGAKDGTDAENNDGDMYTKNNTEPMPSGPPIK